MNKPLTLYDGFFDFSQVVVEDAVMKLESDTMDGKLGDEERAVIRPTHSADKFYSSDPVPGPFDVIIIGSGVSGLTSAAMLCEAGKRVLVLEQHFQPGGFTHTFTRKNYEWDVGVHYLGKASHTSSWYYQLAGLTDGAIKLEPFKQYADELHYPEFNILVPNSYPEYEAALIEKFPKEMEGIRGYFKEIRYVRRKLQLFYGMNLMPKPLTRFARKTFIRRIHTLATQTTDQVMTRFFKDEKLKSVLDAQWGNIGAPRQTCSFLVHAAMVGNYLETGAEYPIGGASVFARELGRTIYRNGSAIRVKAPVKELIIDNRQVGGVVLQNGEEIAAPLVISSNGVFNTYHNFLSGESSCAQTIAQINKLKPAYEYINLFIGFKESPEKFGLGKGNSWIHPYWSDSTTEPTWDIQNLDAHPKPEVLFFSSSSLRDPDLPNRKHNGYNGQIVSAVNYGVFDKWKNTKFKNRGDEYYELKDRISDILMTVLDEKYPGIKDNVDYMELGTTLTCQHFSGSYNGIPYGLAPVPSRYESLLLRPTTPIKNLYICGQDLIMPGVPAAVGSANLCTSLILRKNIGNHWARIGRQL